MSKVAIVTGATSWMAHATYNKLTERDWTVELCAHEDVDVANAEAVSEYVSKMIKKHGQIHAMVTLEG